jgi:hypothetical protein
VPRSQLLADLGKRSPGEEGTAIAKALRRHCGWCPRNRAKQVQSKPRELNQEGQTGLITQGLGTEAVKRAVISGQGMV